MFRITLSPVSVRLIGCPVNGLAAADWRVRHGLQPAPSNRIGFAVCATDETVCREFPEMLDAHANMTDHSVQTALGRNLSLDEVPCEVDAVYPLISTGSVRIEDIDIARVGVDAFTAALKAFFAAAVAAHGARQAEARARQEAAEAEKRAVTAAKEAAILADARAGRLYRQGPRGITRATDLME